MKARVALLGLFSVAVVACSNGSSGGGTTAETSPPPPPSSSASASETPSESATPTPSFSSTVKATKRCRTKQLQVSVGQGQGVAGANVVPIVFTNVSQRACTLFGYPGVSFLDASGAQVGVPATHNGGEEATVTLGPTDTANAELQVPNPGNFSAAACKQMMAAQLRVYPPGNRSALTTGYVNPVCTTKKGAATVHPVTPGSGG